MKKILFIHQNFPGQYSHIAPILKQRGHNVLALSRRKEKHLLGIKNIQYTTSANTPNLPSGLITIDSNFKRAEAIAKECKKLEKNGYKPDVICAHTGWGEAWFLKDIWPEVKLIGYFEYFHHTSGADVNFDPEFPYLEETAFKIRIRNAVILSALEACDIGVTPTHWQHSLFPTAYKEKIQVIHEGINTNKIKPAHNAWVKYNQAGDIAKHGDKIITFVNRNLEPLRGYHQFMRALPSIQQKHPDAHIFIIGSDQAGYGKNSQISTSWKQQYLDEVKAEIDISHIHFTGRIPHNVFINLLQISAVHVYMSYPFVLSWSLLEAMSAGCQIVASDVAPVREVIEHRKTGLLVDFFSTKELANSVIKLLDRKKKTNMGNNARSHIIKKFDFNSHCLTKHLELIEE